MTIDQALTKSKDELRRRTGQTLVVIMLVQFATLVNAQQFERLSYRNEGLIVDLAVGLWAWPLPMDYDQDGDMDLVVSCPDVPHNGTYLFENKQVQNNGIDVLEIPRRIGPGQKNLQVAHLAGKVHVMGPGVLYDNFSESVFDQPLHLYKAKKLEQLHEKIRFSQWKLVDYEGDGDLDLLAGIDDWVDYGWDNAFNVEGEWTNGPLHGYVYLLENEDDTFKDARRLEAGGIPIDVYGAPSPCMEDFDGDGDLDLICGEFLDKFSYFENIGSRSMPIYAESVFLDNDDGLIRMELEMITPSAVDWDNDGDIDLICGDEDGRVALVENLGSLSESIPRFRQPVYLLQKADKVNFGALITPFSVDWDDDGDEDLICGNTAGHIGFIEHLGGDDAPSWAAPKRLTAGGEVIRIMAGTGGSIQGPAECKWGYTTISVADWNGDGLKDIIANSIWGKVIWFENVGEEGAPILSPAKPIGVDWNQDVVPKPAWNWWNPAKEELATQWRTTPQAIDWNQDGLTDLVMLDHEGYLSFYERKRVRDNNLILQPGKRIFFGEGNSVFDRKNTSLSKGSGPLQLNADKFGSSGRRKWCFVDWDADGDLDVLINSENIAWFEQTRHEDDKIFFAFRGNVSNQKLAGHTTSPTTVDWNGDGKPELLVGAEDGFLYYFQAQK